MHLILVLFNPSCLESEGNLRFLTAYSQTNVFLCVNRLTTKCVHFDNPNCKEASRAIGWKRSLIVTHIHNCCLHVVVDVFLVPFYAALANPTLSWACVQCYQLNLERYTMFRSKGVIFCGSLNLYCLQCPGMLIMPGHETLSRYDWK